MNNDKIKQELHELVDNLDYNKASNYIAMMMKDGKTYTVINLIKEKLLYCQKPKVKTLEQKLIDAGFKQSRSFNNIYAKNKINIWLAAHNEFVETSCGADRLRCNLNDHDQIFADIAYLESKIK
jgi:hypothetical protein